MWILLRFLIVSLLFSPLQDVLCYHNFQTGVKVLEHNMTKEIFLEIVKSNLTAEYINSTKEFIKGAALSLLSSLISRSATGGGLGPTHQGSYGKANPEYGPSVVWPQVPREIRLERGAETSQSAKVELLPPIVLTDVGSVLKQTLVTFMSRKLRGFRARCRFE